MTTMTKKTNWMATGRPFAQKIADYQTLVVDNLKVRTECDKQVKEWTSAIESYEKLRGSIFSGDVDGMIAEAEKKIADAKALRKKTLKRWIYSENDYTLYRDYYATGRDLYTRGRGIAVRRWFDANGVDIGADDIEAICKALDGKHANRTAKFVETGEMNTAIRSRVDFLKVFYGEIHDMMVAKNAIRPAMFPEIVRERYIKPKKDKESKKSAK